MKRRSIIGEVFFRILREYLRIMHNKIYYKNIYTIGKENIPPKNTPMIIASNHQNALNDALGVEFAFKDRVVSIFTRADAFNKKFMGKFLRSIYLLPAFRMGHDGLDAVQKNEEIFKEAGDRINSGGSVLIFPEAVNQDKRWLGDFSQGYLRMAFQAAKDSNFEKDIMILPICNHYSNYFKFREDMLIKCGKPISLKPYYEMFKDKPRTVQRLLNQDIRKAIDDLMLNITDLENYESIDFIRETYGKKYCFDCQGNPNYLPDKLLSDKALFRELEEAKEEKPEEILEIYKKTLELKEGYKRFDVKDENFEKKFDAFEFGLKWFGLVILFPLFVVASIPNILVFLSPSPLTKKLKAGDAHMTMFVGGIRFAVGALLAFPLIYLTTFLLEGFFINWKVAIIHTCLLPFLGLFAWNYRKVFINLKRSWRFRNKLKNSIDKKEGLKFYMDLRQNIFNKLDRILKKNTWKKE